MRFVHNHHRRRALTQRFWAKVKIGAADACWEWQGFRLPKGYGTIGVGGRAGGKQLAHRVSYELEYGLIPEGLLVCHSCDNPPCVNPKHLYVGSYADNLTDMHRKGRARGRQREPQTV
jgi:hypothetical protein